MRGWRRIGNCEYDFGISVGNSEIEFLEDALWDVADDAHDGLPDEGDVENVAALIDGGDDGFGDLIDVGEFIAFGHA